jgi:hypothetical protein
VKEYDIFVPLYFNDGRPVEAEKFQQLQQRLLDRFQGLTFFPQPNKGLWQMAGGDLSGRNRDLPRDRARCGGRPTVPRPGQGMVESRIRTA